MNQVKIDAEVTPAPKVGEEMKRMAAEPLLPIEKKLIAWSLGLGIVLLVVLVAASRMFLHAAT
ncbi:MAG TPA: hypothetical protein VN782_06415 [Usitatibacter sp.]|nr:hypothetical protein [Usitatibacter sp.]